MKIKPVIFCDFDGTITLKDSLVHILDEFVGPSWKEIEVKVKNGEMGSRISLVEEFNMLKGTWDDIRESLDHSIEIDPHFSGFLNFCEESEIEFSILSGGFTLFIDFILNKYGIKNVVYHANIIKFTGNRARIEFPYPPNGCSFCGHCKTQHLKKSANNGYSPIIYIGDGTTDRCPVKISDIVFAKDSLARYCAREGINYFQWSNFLDVQTRLKNILK